jgi:hypothetical protein
VNNLLVTMNNQKTNKQQLAWRRTKVLELSSKGFLNQMEIASVLKISQPTVQRDLNYIARQAKESLRNHIDQELPLQFQKAMTGLDLILRQAWTMVDNANSDRDKAVALSLAMETYKLQLELSSDSNVLDAAIKFIQLQKEKLHV